jgi:ankyrin repeat protein
VVGTLLGEEELHINAEVHGGERAITFAADGGHEAVVRLLLDKGAHTTWTVHLGGDTFISSILHQAAYEELYRRMFTFLDAGMDRRARQDCTSHQGTWHRDFPPSTKYGLPNRKLPGYTVNVDATNNYGKTALHYAMEGLSCWGTGVVVQLLPAGADFEIQDNDGKTPQTICRISSTCTELSSSETCYARSGGRSVE